MESETLTSEVSAPLRALPSGRSVVLKLGDGCEQLEVRSPTGDVEVCITLSDQGATVRLRGGELQMQSPDAVSLNCRRLDVITAEGTALASGGDVLITGREMCVKTENDIRLNGSLIHLNC
ncbi:MAG TPA: hypothetical protein VHZ24_10150 [Pirellulales bacterium]|jgi:hypothetical protein|nr:hypothetical protein [Pirellulales bacterium]